MIALTGWQLLFSENASSVVLKGRGHFASQKKIEGALVTVWERENERGKDVQLLVRASSTSGEPKSTTWLSASREWHSRLGFNRASLCIHKMTPPTYVVRF